MGGGLSKRIRQVKELRRNYEELERIKLKRMMVENEMKQMTKVLKDQEEAMLKDRDAALKYLEEIQKKKDIIEKSVDNEMKKNA